MMCLKRTMGILFVAALAHAEAREIKTIDFRVEGDQSVVELIGDGPLTVMQADNPETNQVVLEVSGARLGAGAKRKLDTSSFNSPVILISPYAKGDGSQVVIQLRAPGSAVLSQSGSRATLSVTSTGASAALEAAMPADPLGPEGPEGLEKSPPLAKEEPSPVATPPTGLAAFEEAQRTHRFTGSPITIQVRDADLKDVFRLIGEASGFNIVLDPDVNGKITLSLIDVPWDQALDVVLSTGKLGAERNYNILRVMTLKNMTAEKKAQLEAKQAAESVAPKITRIFAINYANPDDLVKTLKDVGKTSVGDRIAEPTIVVDKRTSSIIVQDTQDNVDRMAKLIEMLDTQTPQIMIEARVVEAKEEFSKVLNGAFGGGASQGNDGSAVALNGINPLGGLIGSPGLFSTSDGIATAANNGAFIGGAPLISAGSFRINAFLKMTESENLQRTVTAPKTVVLNRETAVVSQTFPVLLPTTTISAGGPVTSYTQVDAKIELKVEANVTNDESILMNVDLSRDVVEQVTGGSAPGKRGIKTKILVDNGSTVVMGGIFVSDISNGEGGVPFLRKIPILGALFSNSSKSENRRELFFFITPRILNRTKAGLTQ